MCLVGAATWGLHRGLPSLRPPWGYLIAVNIVTFALFGLDKRLARRKKSRTPEAALLTLTFLGGAAGAIVAMPFFRHKTKKAPFQWAFVSTVVLQLALLAAWFYWIR